MPFGGTSPDARDLGLAYVQIAPRVNAWAAHEARRLLEAATLPRYGSDAEVLTRLAYLEQAGNRLDRAEALYEQSIDIDPSQPVAATNLGVILAERGLTARALDVRASGLRSPSRGERARCGSRAGKLPARRLEGRRRGSPGPCSRTIRTSTPPVRWQPCWHAAPTPAAATDQVSRRP